MGRDKARLRLGSRTLLGQIRSMASDLGLRARIIRHDLVARCGPVGGVFSGLSTGREQAFIFLSCDMPFVSTDLLRALLKKSNEGRAAVFCASSVALGFPFILPRDALRVVERQLKKADYSLQRLARLLRSKTLRLSPAQEWEIFNINTPRDLAEARRIWREKRLAFRPSSAAR